MLKSCLLQASILGFPTEEDRFVLDTDTSLFAIGGVLNQIQGDQELAGVSGSLNAGTVLHVGKCWPPLRCVLIFVLISGELSLLYTRITGPFGGFKSFAIVMVCWSVGICFSASSRLPLNIDQGHSLLMLMAFPVSVVSACNRISTGTTGPWRRRVWVYFGTGTQPFAESAAMGDSMDSDLLPELSGET